MNFVHVPIHRRGRNRKRRFLVFVVIMGVIAALAAWKWVAPVPAQFDPQVTFQQASAKAIAEGKPVLAVVTADYCLQCQIYKRTALVDPRVTEWIKDNAETAYVKWGTQEQDMERLGVTGFPATVYIPAVGEPRVHIGTMSADELLEFLKSAATTPAPASEPIPAG